MAKSRKQFSEGPLYTISSYILWFFLGNLYFVLFNIPMLFILIVLSTTTSKAITQEFTPIFIICCFPIAPAATALLSVMGKLIREKDISISKDYFKAYKTNFIQSTFFGALEILIISILFIDIKFSISSGYPRLLTIALLLIMTFVFLMGIYVFPIISRFYLTTKDILKLAAHYTIKKFNITLLCFSNFLIAGFIFFKISTFILVFLSSIICYSILFYQQKILIEIEDKLKKETEKIPKVEL